MPDFGAFNRSLRARLPVIDLYLQLQHLSDINEDLTKEVASLRTICAQTDDKIHLLQNALHTHNVTSKHLIADIDLLKQERDSIQSKLATEVADLDAELRVVESEKEIEVEENESVKAELKASMDELAMLEGCIESNEMALFPAQNRLFIHAFEIEMLWMLIHEKIDYSFSLNASTREILRMINGEQRKIEILTQDTVASKISLDRKTSSVEGALAELSLGYAMEAHCDQHIKLQLNEARDKLGHIEITDHLITARETELDAQIFTIKEQLRQQREENSILLKRIQSIPCARSDNIPLTEINAISRPSPEFNPRCPVKDAGTEKYGIPSATTR